MDIHLKSVVIILGLIGKNVYHGDESAITKIETSEDNTYQR